MRLIIATSLSLRTALLNAEPVCKRVCLVREHRRQRRALVAVFRVPDKCECRHSATGVVPFLKSETTLKGTCFQENKGRSATCFLCLCTDVRANVIGCHSGRDGARRQISRQGYQGSREWSALSAAIFAAGSARTRKQSQAPARHLSRNTVVWAVICCWKDSGPVCLRCGGGFGSRHQRAHCQHLILWIHVSFSTLQNIVDLNAADMNQSVPVGHDAADRCDALDSDVRFKA